jgi:hypothetical protein
MGIAFVPGAPVSAAPREQRITLMPGSVVGLQGTPHIFVVDGQGVLHWGGDTRGLAGHYVNWSDRRDLSLDQIKGLPSGDPWLSAGLFKNGDSISLVKWETGQAAPTLLHIQNIGDVQLFGINANNYGSFVLDRAAWEQRYGVKTDGLATGELVSATAPQPAPGASATTTPSPAGNRVSARLVSVLRPSLGSFRTTFEITDLPRTTIRATLVRDEFNYCSDGCGSDQSTNHDGWGPRDVGTTDDNGKLTWTDEHSAFKSSTYTFTDPNGGSAAVTLGSDLDRGI